MNQKKVFQLKKYLFSAVFLFFVILLPNFAFAKVSDSFTGDVRPADPFSVGDMTPVFPGLKKKWFGDGANDGLLDQLKRQMEKEYAGVEGPAWIPPIQIDFGIAPPSILQNAPVGNCGVYWELLPGGGYKIKMTGNAVCIEKKLPDVVRMIVLMKEKSKKTAIPATPEIPLWITNGETMSNSSCYMPDSYDEFQNVLKMDKKYYTLGLTGKQQDAFNKSAGTLVKFLKMAGGGPLVSDVNSKGLAKALQDFKGGLLSSPADLYATMKDWVSDGCRSFNYDDSKKKFCAAPGSSVPTYVKPEPIVPIPMPDVLPVPEKPKPAPISPNPVPDTTKPEIPVPTKPDIRPRAKVPVKIVLISGDGCMYCVVLKKNLDTVILQAINAKFGSGNLDNIQFPGNKLYNEINSSQNQYEAVREGFTGGSIPVLIISAPGMEPVKIVGNVNPQVVIDQIQKINDSFTGK